MPTNRNQPNLMPDGTQDYYFDPNEYNDERVPQRQPNAYAEQPMQKAQQVQQPQLQQTIQPQETQRDQQVFQRQPQPNGSNQPQQGGFWSGMKSFWKWSALTAIVVGGLALLSNPIVTIVAISVVGGLTAVIYGPQIFRGVKNLFGSGKNKNMNVQSAQPTEPSVEQPEQRKEEKPLEPTQEKQREKEMLGKLLESPEMMKEIVNNIYEDRYALGINVGVAREIQKLADGNYTNVDEFQRDLKIVLKDDYNRVMDYIDNQYFGRVEASRQEMFVQNVDRTIDTNMRELQNKIRDNLTNENSELSSISKQKIAQMKNFNDLKEIVSRFSLGEREIAEKIIKETTNGTLENNAEKEQEKSFESFVSDLNILESRYVRKALERLVERNKDMLSLSDEGKNILYGAESFNKLMSDSYLELSQQDKSAVESFNKAFGIENIYAMAAKIFNEDRGQQNEVEPETQPEQVPEPQPEQNQVPQPSPEHQPAPKPQEGVLQSQGNSTGPQPALERTDSSTSIEVEQGPINRVRQTAKAYDINREIEATVATKYADEKLAGLLKQHPDVPRVVKERLKNGEGIVQAVKNSDLSFEQRRNVMQLIKETAQRNNLKTSLSDLKEVGRRRSMERSSSLESNRERTNV